MLQIRIATPSFFNNPTSETVARELLQSTPRKIVGLNLSAGRRWPSKSLILDEAIHLIDLLNAIGANAYYLAEKMTLTTWAQSLPNERSE